MLKPKFKPKARQIDFTHSRFAPVINCVVKYKDKILMVQRSEKLNFYPGLWNGIAGFLDDERSLTEKVYDEIREELGVPKSKIGRIRVGEIFEQEEKKYKKVWIVHPVLVEVKTDKIKLDFEAKNYKWLMPREVGKLKLVPGLGKVLRRVLG